MRILTTYDCPPIPTRDFDFSAVDDDTYGGEPSDAIGRGPTPAAAIEDLANASLQGDEPDWASVARAEAKAQEWADVDTLAYIDHLRDAWGVSPNKPEETTV